MDLVEHQEGIQEWQRRGTERAAELHACAVLGGHRIDDLHDRPLAPRASACPDHERAGNESQNLATRRGVDGHGPEDTTSFQRTEPRLPIDAWYA